MKPLKFTILLLAISAGCIHSKAYNIRQINSWDGLSNSAVICMLQDNERYLWLGTYDGLNKYNGTEISIYKPDIRNHNSLSGNVIRKMVESKDGYIWIMTKGGLNLYSKKKDQVEAYFSDFQEDCAMFCDKNGDFFLITQKGVLYNYDFSKREFIKITVPGFKPTQNWISLIIDNNDNIWLTNNGIIRQYKINRSIKNQIRLDPDKFEHPQTIISVYYDKGKFIFVDGLGDLYVIKSGKKSYIRNIQTAIKQNGDITSILHDRNDIIIAFRTNGVIRLDHKNKFAIEKFPINCGVFSLLKDDVQDILWIGTDGQGVYAYVQEAFIFKGINLDELPIKKQRPIRAIYSDNQNNLWLGTKGNGIIRVKNYENATEFNLHNIEHISQENGLSNNEVFSFEMSHKNNILWIGSGGPDLNYFAYNDKRIHTLKNNSHTPFIEVHSLLEESENVLWVTSLFTLLKVEIQKKGATIETRRVQKYDFNIKNKQRFNKIYSICRENDSIMWLAMRGNGAIRFNSINGTYRLVTFNKNGITPMNDILSIHMDKYKNMWFGSSYGINLLKKSTDGKYVTTNFNETDGLANNTIHGILENRNGKLWLSSNSGIVLFDPLKKTFRKFNQKSGLKVIEFSDNAYHMDKKHTKYFFGGVDGVVWIQHEEKKKNNFVPPIYFTRLRIMNKDNNIDDFLIQKKGRNTLQLKYNQNFFTIAFSTNDFIDGANIKFSYMLENFNEVWMNTNSREAQFTNIPPGKYVLKVKSGNEFEKENQVASLYIEIQPPWYLSIYAKIFYTLAIIGLLYLIYIYSAKKYETKRVKIAQEIDQKYKEEMYENKLRFFTNITHEFCTPLTLIHTPSERILNYEGSDQFIKKYAHIIKSNSERLNYLIQEIIDFRRMETGNKIRKIEICNINELCKDIRESYSDLIEENNIHFNIENDDVINWNTDRSCFNTILNNLVSNAFKYTPVNGIIKIAVSVENEELVIKVYNSGKGIKNEDYSRIFNRYSVLDNIDQNSIKGLSSRNGLGLAICKSMIELLNGKIEIESEVGKYAQFTIKLPVCELDKTANRKTDNSEQQPDNQISELINKTTNQSASSDNNSQKPIYRPTILIVDDNEEILFVLKESLSDDFTIVTAKDGNDGLERVINYMPDLVITDIMMPNQDGISMTKRIKTNPHTMHIPLIIISAKSAINDKIEGIESGADAYISKPFDIQYIKTVSKQLIEKHKKLKDYYKSSVSSFDYMNGQLLPKDDRDFIQLAISTIDQNINNADFSPEDLADNLHVSLRSLYRRFKDLGLLPPKDFIKKQRIEYSAKLLLSTNLTIHEIMYSAGFNTRSHFYNEFIKRYNISPKEYRKNDVIDTSSTL